MGHWFLKHYFVMIFACLITLSCGRNLPWSELRTVALTNQCISEARSAVISKNPNLTNRELDFIYQIELDCAEAQLIDNLADPVKSAIPIKNMLHSFFDLLHHVSFVNRAMEILKPYCRNDNWNYGSFCIATDVDAAWHVTSNRQMLDALPQAIEKIAADLETNESINITEIVMRNYAGNTSDAVLLASFIGLDDNGIQVDRLRANLIKQRRFGDYARIFAMTAQYANFNNLPHAHDMAKVLFATRIGLATLPGVAINASKTYKAYAGMHLGCRLAMSGESQTIVSLESYAVGASYELLKLRKFADHPLDEFRDLAIEHAKASDETGWKMSAGAAYGFNLCKNKSG